MQQFVRHLCRRVPPRTSPPSAKTGHWKADVLNRLAPRLGRRSRVRMSCARPIAAWVSLNSEQYGNACVRGHRDAHARREPVAWDASAHSALRQRLASSAIHLSTRVIGSNGAVRLAYRRHPQTRKSPSRARTREGDDDTGSRPGCLPRKIGRCPNGENRCWELGCQSRRNPERRLPEELKHER